VRAVLKDVENGHGLVRESVDEDCLQLALHVMANYHRGAQLLVERERGHFAVDLLTEGEEKAGNQDRSKVLNQEYGRPADLRPEVLKNYDDITRLSDIRLLRFCPVSKHHLFLFFDNLKSAPSCVNTLLLAVIRLAECLAQFLHCGSALDARQI